MRSSVSQPSMPGMTTSSSTMSGRSSLSTRRHSWPSAAVATSYPTLSQAMADDRSLRGAVLDEQHGDPAHGRPSLLAAALRAGGSTLERAASLAWHASITVVASTGPARRSAGEDRTRSVRRACS